MERQSFNAEYLERLARGDAETELHFTAYFGELLYLKLRGRIRSPQLAEDARQDTFFRVLKIVRTKGGIEQPERLGAFVNAVCEHVVAEMIRGEQRYAAVPENAREPADHAADAETECITEERKLAVRKMLDSLRAGDRKLLRRVFLEEADKDEVAKEMGITRDYLRVRVHRALTKLRSSITKREERASSGKASTARASGG